MTKFPAYTPSTRRIKYGNWNVKRGAPGRSNQTFTKALPTTAVKNDVTFELTYNNRSDSVASEFMDHYLGQNGVWDDFELGKDSLREGIMAGWEADNNITNGRWCYARPPQIVSTHPGTNNIPISLTSIKNNTPVCPPNAYPGGGSDSSGPGGGRPLPRPPGPGSGAPITPFPFPDWNDPSIPVSNRWPDDYEPDFPDNLDPALGGGTQYLDDGYTTQRSWKFTARESWVSGGSYICCNVPITPENEASFGIDEPFEREFTGYGIKVITGMGVYKRDCQEYYQKPGEKYGCCWSGGSECAPININVPVLIFGYYGRRSPGGDWKMLGGFEVSFTSGFGTQYGPRGAYFEDSRWYELLDFQSRITNSNDPFAPKTPVKTSIDNKK